MMLPTMARTLAGAAVLLLSSQAALAHHPWLLPNQTLLDGKDAAVAIDAAASEDLFEFDTRGLPLDSLVVTGPDGSKIEPRAVNTSSRHRSSFELNLDRPGTYRVASVSQGVMASYKLGNETKRFRGSQQDWDKERPPQAEEVRVTRLSNRIETFVARDKPSDKPFAAVGQGLELIPLDAPVDLSDGDRTRFRLLLDGQPLVDAAISLMRGGNRYRYKMGEQTLRSDGRGEFAVAWTEPGRYWLGVNHSVPADGAATPSQPPQRRFSYSATFEVRPR